MSGGEANISFDSIINDSVLSSDCLMFRLGYLSWLAYLVILLSRLKAMKLLYTAIAVLFGIALKV